MNSDIKVQSEETSVSIENVSEESSPPPPSEAVEACSAPSEREESSPSLIRCDVITEMGFAADDELVFINNKSINILEQMRDGKEFKSVLSLNLDDDHVTPGSK